MTKKRLAVLISGSGSNLLALARAAKRRALGGSEIAVVICNEPGARGIARARRLGLPVVVIAHRDFPSREAHEAAVRETLRRYKIHFILLAGYMRLLTPAFVRGWKNKILNTHPALLPAFPGGHGARDALSYGVKVSGCTIHFVSEAMDAGPIILQRAVDIKTGDTAASLQKRIQQAEHLAYPEAVRLLCAGRLRVRGRRVFVRG